MKGYRLGLGVVGICLLLLAWGTVASATDDILSEAEKRMFSGFELEEDLAAFPKFTTQFSARLTQARVRYEEHFSSISDTDSDWEAWMTRGDMMLTSYYERDSESDIGLEIDFGVFRTTTDEENWDIDGGANQENDTDFDGWELKLSVGWLYDLGGPWEFKQLVSYGHRIIGFERKRFVVGGVKLVNMTPVKEDYTIDYLEYSPQFTVKAEKGWSLSFKPSFAYVVGNEAYNDAYDVTITGKGGIIASGELLLNYQFTEVVTGYIGAMGEWQYLEGNTVTEDGLIIEWPDNELSTYGGMIGLSVGI